MNDWWEKYFAKLSYEEILVFIDLAGIPNRGAYWLESGWDNDFESQAKYMNELKRQLIPCWVWYEHKM